LCSLAHPLSSSSSRSPGRQRSGSTTDTIHPQQRHAVSVASCNSNFAKHHQYRTKGDDEQFYVDERSAANDGTIAR
jgi:hypothetical protein